MSRRTDRIEDLLRAELSDLMRRELRDPRAHLASVASIDVTPDLRHARVHVSALGDDAQRAGAVAALNHARGFLRSQLARRLRHLRVTPELDFELDRGAEYSQRIEDLLADLHPHPADGSAPGDGDDEAS